MVTTASSSKKGVSNPRSAAVPVPVLLSPISVAHRSKMMEEGGAKSGAGNSIRDQWVANLKKKRLGAAAGLCGPIGNGNPAPATSASSVASTTTGSGSSRNSNSSRGGTTKKSSRNRSSGSRAKANASRNRNAAQQQHSVVSLEKNLNAHQRNAHRHSQFATVPTSTSLIDSQLTMAEADALVLGNPAMLFSDISCFELESPSFTRILGSPSLDSNELATQLQYPLLSSSAPTAKTTTKKPRSRQKKSGKTLVKKRPTHCLVLDVNQPKPRTPRRKLNSGAASFDDLDLVDYDLDLSHSSLSASFSSVGTPSNFHLDSASGQNRSLWGPELDFAGSGSYADTFLDLPTPRLAEMPLVSPSNQTNDGTVRRPAHDKIKEEARLDQPRLIRTNSIEQEGLSHFLEQTNLDGSGGGDGNELYQLATTPHITKNSSPSSQSYSTASSSTSHSSISYPQTSAAAAAVVDECLGSGKMPPFSMSWAMPSPLAPGSSRSGPAMESGDRRRLTPREQSQKQVAEFETLQDEYKFTDIDQEFDSYYLDTIEAIGSDMDLMSN